MVQQKGAQHLEKALLTDFAWMEVVPRNVPMTMQNVEEGVASLQQHYHYWEDVGARQSERKK